jgi:hypothetical protein
VTIPAGWAEAGAATAVGAAAIAAAAAPATNSVVMYFGRIRMAALLRLAGWPCLASLSNNGQCRVRSDHSLRSSTTAGQSADGCIDVDQEPPTIRIDILWERGLTSGQARELAAVLIDGRRRESSYSQRESSSLSMVADMPQEERAQIDAVQRRLAQKYAELPHDHVAAVVKHVYARFNESTVRDYVPLLVERRAREELTSTVEERDAAQATELVRALCDQLHEMTHQLVWCEHQDVTGRNGRASAIRREAAALRRDLKEAQALIDRLKRRYLNSDGHAQPRRPARHQAPASE